jgi:iron-sulfur cluster assembly protein
MIAKPVPTIAAVPNFRRGDERLVKLTESAARKVTALLCKQGRPGGVLRVAVVGGGCSGLQYKMDLQEGPANRDFLVESGGVNVVVDPKSALYVTGSELDYVDALDGGFKVKNPNAATSCSCGEVSCDRPFATLGEPRRPWLMRRQEAHRLSGRVHPDRVHGATKLRRSAVAVCGPQRGPPMPA